MKLLHVVGARPNFPKLAPVHRAADNRGLEQVVVHTGQHYDAALSDSFFDELGIVRPDVNLDVGSASHAVQTARVLERIEPIIERELPDWLLVYGDVNSTMAAAIAASKLGVNVAHVEAGLRSDDRSMPEEINRIVTDRIASLLLTHSRDADARLRSEGEPDDEIAFVGNVMVDSLLFTLDAARRNGCRKAFGVDERTVIVTLHRPSNVDDRDRLRRIARALGEIAEERTVIFPMHPRTQLRVAADHVDFGRVRVVPPVTYLEMLDLLDGCAVAITDSGGIQEETTALGVRCLTVRENTERPITITEGTNQLVPEPADLPLAVRALPVARENRRPEGWDGRAGERVVAALLTHHERGAGARTPRMRLSGSLRG